MSNIMDSIRCFTLHHLRSISTPWEASIYQSGWKDWKPQWEFLQQKQVDQFITEAQSPLWVARVFGVCLLLTLLYKTFLAKKSREEHLQSMCEAPSKNIRYDRLLGLDILWESFVSIQEHRYLSKVQERFRRHGNTFRSLMLGRAVYNTCEPQNLKAILATQFEDFGLGQRRTDAFEPLLGHGIFTSDGKDWASAREILKPAFQRTNIDLSVLSKHTTNLLRAIDHHQSASKKSTVDVQSLFFSFTLDTASDLFFGASSCALLARADDHSGDVFADAFNTTQRWVADNFVLGWIAFLRPQKKFNEARKVLFEHLDTHVSRVLEAKRQRDTAPNCEKDSSDDQDNNNKECYVVLEQLAESINDRVALRHHLLNLLVAGRDTTASLLSSLWHTLAQRSDVWEKLQTEVDALGVHCKEPSSEDLKNMPYLQGCIKESLRLNPPVPVNMRTALRATTLPRGGGDDGQSPVYIPSGTNVGYSVYAMHRRQDIWGPDSHVFRPERWMEDEQKSRDHWAFLPFNGGHRICLGQQLALTEAAFVTARLVQEYEQPQLFSNSKWRESLTLACCLHGGLELRFKRCSKVATQDSDAR